MVTHLFNKFLIDTEIYKRNVDFWKTIIYTLLSVDNLTFKTYLTTEKADGTIYTDGNPICNFKMDNSNRAVRIIQEEIESNEVEFSAWMNTLKIDNEEVEELVISMELSNESVLLTIELINAWIVSNLSKPKMEKYIDKLFALKETIFKANSPEQEKLFA